MDTQLRRLRQRVARKLANRRFVRFGLLAANVLVLIAVFMYVSSSSQAQSLSTSLPNASSNTSNDPIDQLSAADIAVNIAQAADMPETTAVTNQADSVNSELSIAPVTNTIVSEPQEVATAFESRFDIQPYTVQPGDSVASIAAHFNVTSSSIEWSNGLSGSTVVPGTKLLIPPVNGIVYTVKQGDTAQSLAQKYSADQAQIVAFNDAELSGLQVGEQIVIPNGQPPAAPTYSAADLFSGIGGSLAASYAGFGQCEYGGKVYSNYGYDCGFCTWWAAMQRATHGDPVPSNLGEAYSWAANAAAIGIPEGNTPQPGAVITFGSGDHVAYVESVGSDGSATISEMNREGWDIVDTRTLPAIQADSYTYIY
jgi:N-acetylmuramoyl-L-alanine amidase